MGGSPGVKNFQYGGGVKNFKNGLWGVTVWHTGVAKKGMLQSFQPIVFLFIFDYKQLLILGLKQKSKHGEEDQISALQDKLSTEANNILQWKVSTELELQSNQKKLKEAEITVEKQRENLRNQQLHNEILSNKLQIELQNREELEEK